MRSYSIYKTHYFPVLSCPLSLSNIFHLKVWTCLDMSIMVRDSNCTFRHQPPICNYRYFVLPIVQAEAHFSNVYTTVGIVDGAQGDLGFSLSACRITEFNPGTGHLECQNASAKCDNGMVVVDGSESNGKLLVCVNCLEYHDQTTKLGICICWHKQLLNCQRDFVILIRCYVILADILANSVIWIVMQTWCHHLRREVWNDQPRTPSNSRLTHSCLIWYKYYNDGKIYWYLSPINMIKCHMRVCSHCGTGCLFQGNLCCHFFRLGQSQS